MLLVVPRCSTFVSTWRDRLPNERRSIPELIFEWVLRIGEPAQQYLVVRAGDHVVAGQSLRIPPIQAIETARPAASKPEAPTTGAPTYTVKPDETLSEIAQRVLGTARRWEELFELNRSILSDPNTIRAGMELRLPENP